MDRKEQKRLAAKRIRDQREAAGMVQVSAWVHSHQASDVKLLLAVLAKCPDLIVGPVRDERTNKLVSLRKRS
ncbi:hypothetical protein [Mesorhizobium sp.]|uniref:hypothetical protein n=1 Tax=Mesorhizobium sp. TaxID=1871066 RepID=UPI0012036A29|nr:hypothetical protein [Mesorhizobium sp.]TIS45684.1 MAG: hypothetical protein E5W96_30195 [Mesorhizobium sp.]